MEASHTFKACVDNEQKSSAVRIRSHRPSTRDIKKRLSNQLSYSFSLCEGSDTEKTPVINEYGACFWYVRICEKTCVNRHLLLQEGCVVTARNTMQGRTGEVLLTGSPQALASFSHPGGEYKHVITSSSFLSEKEEVSHKTGVGNNGIWYHDLASRALAESFDQARSGLSAPGKNSCGGKRSMCSSFSFDVLVRRRSLAIRQPKLLVETTRVHNIGAQLNWSQIFENRYIIQEQIKTPRTVRKGRLIVPEEKLTNEPVYDFVNLYW